MFDTPCWFFFPSDKAMRNAFESFKSLFDK